MRRIGIVLMPEEENVLQQVMDATACSITDAVRVALGLVGENFANEMIHDYYLALKRRDRGRRKEDDH